MTINAILSRASQPKEKETPPAAMHSNPVIATILHQLHTAAAKDDLNARTSITKYKQGFYTGRADAKRHLISVLAQTRI